MCIAITKQIGCDCPNMDTLKTCWDNNPDGAGFAFNLNGRVFIKKGFMTWTAFKNAFEYWNKKVCFKSRGLLIHFRIATHGAKNETMTHPFPIVADEGTLSKPEYSSPYAIIHNGIISLTSTAIRGTGLSDTATFVKDYLTDIASYSDWFYNEKTMTLIYNLIDSKMAIINGKGEIIRTLGFEEEKDSGIFYSNTTYKENRYKTIGNYSSYYPNKVVGSEEKKASVNSKLIKLMQIPSNAIILLDDNTEYMATDCCEGREGWYISEDNIIYYGYLDVSYSKIEQDDSWAEYFMEYEEMGKGRIYDNRGVSIGFIGTTAIYPEQLI